MALNRFTGGEHLRPMRELDSYRIEKGDPDPRGWPVVGSDGHRLGKVDDLIVDVLAMKVRHLIVDLDRDNITSPAAEDAVVLNIEDVDVRNDRQDVLAKEYSGAGFGTATRAFAYTRQADRTDERAGRTDERSTLTRSEEEVDIGKREVTRGEARIGKHVETEHISEPVTRRREEVVIERRPVESGARADAKIEEEEIRVPLREEEVVVEKRPVVKEELVVGKRTVEDRDTVETDVRREKFDIQNEGREPQRDTKRDKR